MLQEYVCLRKADPRKGNRSFIVFIDIDTDPQQVGAAIVANAYFSQFVLIMEFYDPLRSVEWVFPVDCCIQNCRKPRSLQILHL